MNSRAKPMLSRRAVLAVSASVLVCGCARQPVANPSSSSKPLPRATPPSSAAANGFTREQAIAKFGNEKPTAWGQALPGMALTLGERAKKDNAIALTFDACGGPTPTSSGCGYDAKLIDLLRKKNAKATLFLNHRWIAANPQIAQELAHDPLFEIGNHGMRHMPLSVSGQKGYAEQGTHDVGEAYDEVAGNVQTLTSLTGRAPRWFRSGTAFCDDVAVRLVADLDQRVVNFSVNGDWGTTAAPAQIVANLATVRAGDIVISHFNRPEHPTAAGYARGLDAVLAKFKTATLSEYLGA